MKMQDKRTEPAMKKKIVHRELGLMSNEFWLKINGIYYTVLMVSPADICYG